MLIAEPKDSFRQARPIVKCKDGKWRTSEDMMRDQIYPECSLCGDEVRRLRGDTVIEHLKGNSTTANTKILTNNNAKSKYRVYCCQDCAILAMEDRDAKAQW